uniref:Uncharacterized protein n=1 Tax=Klebsiella pneumoniae TaxID=573 RepID=A0A483I3W4_KLEPN
MAATIEGCNEVFHAGLSAGILDLNISVMLSFLIFDSRLNEIIHHHRQGLQCRNALYSSPPGGTIHESWWDRTITLIT